ncbi:MAG: ATP-dependent DNA helicase RecG [Bacteroidales bacterium]|nr:ATP-dependent DNA helicase RecG [Bacteroidales bacterium]
MRELETGIQFLRGVGPRRAALLERELGLRTLDDLIHFFPFRYVDRSRMTPISAIAPDVAYVQVRAKVVERKLISPKHLSVLVEDADASRMEMVFFKGVKWNYERMSPGAVFVFFGKPQVYKGRLNMVHPEVDIPQEGGLTQGSLTGIYPSTEKLKAGGVTGKVLCRMQEEALSRCLPEIRETLPDAVMQQLALCPLAYALRNIHFPLDAYALQKAERRLKTEELLFLQLSLLKQKYVRRNCEQGIRMPLVGAAFHACYRALPYALTGAQQRVVREIRADLAGGHQMNRLLQGDVGSGKTMVAVLSCLIAIGNGYQACIMAPTEVLARQHYENISRYLRPTSVRCALLTGSTPKKERKAVLAALADGTLGIVVGTHALLEDTVQFHALGLAVIDEQHRFGVDQRSRLWQKGPLGNAVPDAPVAPPHVLVMTATPIPRTLAMTLYGDLEVSVIDEMPPGRKPVKTLLAGPSKRAAMYRFLRGEIAAGSQVFIVYPMIFNNEKMEDVSNVERGYEEIVREFPLPDYKVAIVHGQQRPEDKNFNMKAFAEGRAHILVSTTVIEVGVDVPNASVMVIEGAERFGLSQLHQLRGRVGRGDRASCCILMRGEKCSRESVQRLELLCRTENGFEIAEADMRMRGPGDLEGTQQSGLPVALRLASPARDGRLLEEARAMAKRILEADPFLRDPANGLLAAELQKQQYAIKDYSKIS